eukprot:2349584-Pyramimonas_sp.AAC.1
MTFCDDAPYARIGKFAENYSWSDAATDYIYVYARDQNQVGDQTLINCYSLVTHPRAAAVKSSLTARPKKARVSTRKPRSRRPK